METRCSCTAKIRKSTFSANSTSTLIWELNCMLYPPLYIDSDSEACAAKHNLPGTFTAAFPMKPLVQSSMFTFSCEFRDF